MHRMHFEHVRLDLISLVILYNFDHHTKYSTESEWKRVDIQSLSPTLTIHSIAPIFSCNYQKQHLIIQVTNYF